jgi:hypothetical protein
VSILHIEFLEKCGDEGLLAKTDAGACTVFLTVDLMLKNWQARPRLVIMYFPRDWP